MNRLSVYLLAGYVKVKGGWIIISLAFSSSSSPFKVLPDVVAHRRNALPALVRGKNASGACPECVRCSNGWRRQPTGAAPCSRNCETFLHWSSTSSSCRHPHKSSPDWNRKSEILCFIYLNGVFISSVGSGAGAVFLARTRFKMSNIVVAGFIG